VDTAARLRSIRVVVDLLYLTLRYSTGVGAPVASDTAARPVRVGFTLWRPRSSVATRSGRAARTGGQSSVPLPWQADRIRGDRVAVVTKHGRRRRLSLRREHQSCQARERETAQFVGRVVVEVVDEASAVVGAGEVTAGGLPYLHGVKHAVKFRHICQ
jgi:hypothetical protein